MMKTTSQIESDLAGSDLALMSPPKKEREITNPVCQLDNTLTVNPSSDLPGDEKKQSPHIKFNQTSQPHAARTSAGSSLCVLRHPAASSTALSSSERVNSTAICRVGGRGQFHGTDLAAIDFHESMRGRFRLVGERPSIPGSSSALGLTNLSEIGMLGSRYESINSRAGERPGSSNR